MMKLLRSKLNRPYPRSSARNRFRVRSSAVNLFAMLALGTLSNLATAQQPFDFFWSTQEPGSCDLVNNDVFIDVMSGDSQTLYLYYTTDGPSQSELRFGGGLEIAASSSGIIRFDAAETFDFDIVVGGSPIGQRWDSDNGGGHVGPADMVTDDFIDQFDFFTVLGSGIVNENTGPVTLDSGYDAVADAFLIGSIELTALSDGTIDLTTVMGDPISLTNDGFNPLFPEFGTVSINVVQRFSVVDGTLTVNGTNEPDVIDVSSLNGTTTVNFNGDQQDFNDVNEVSIHSGAGNDEITVSGLARSKIFGGYGDDTITVNGSTRSEIFGECGDDILTGGFGPDVIEGGPGNDELNGRGGADFLDGGSLVVDGPNMNTIRGGNGPDTILGGQETDIIFGGDGADIIETFAGNDMIDGGRGNDEIDAAEGNDIIAGNSGNDTISAGEGDDEVSGAGGQDNINGGPGNDEITGGNASDIIQGGLGNDIIHGNDGLDILSGGAGVDQIFGGRAADTIFGGIGNDILSGQSENDVINGNAGDDTLTGGSGNDLLDGGSGSDTATDDGELGEISIETT